MRREVIVAIDGINLYCFKRGPKIKPGEQRKERLLDIPLKTIGRIERAIYNEKKVYIWYTSKCGKKPRATLELEDVASTNQLLAEIRFIGKTVLAEPIHS